MIKKDFEYKILTSYHSDPHAAISQLASLTLDALKHGYQLQGAPFVYSGMVYQAIFKETTKAPILSDKIDSTVSVSVETIPFLPEKHKMENRDLQKKGKK